MSTDKAAEDLMGTPNDPKASMEQKAAAQPQASQEAVAAAAPAAACDDMVHKYSG